jgi:DNA-binding SARP family transcriptional activator/tetratricopeptide (TPR) repeat protein
MIQIQSLGGISIQGPDGMPIRLRSRKHVGLLLYLAMSGRRMFTREHLTSLFWTTPSERARHSLSQAAYDLRTHLQGALVRGSGEQLSLDGRNLEFDAIEFERAVKEGRLGTAIEIYRGPFAQNLAGAGTAEFDRWVETERLRIGRLAEVTFRRFAGECESKGRWGEMCVAAMRLTDMTPLDEEAHLCLMRGLWLHGDPTAALKHYNSATELLKRELPAGPSDRMTDLADRIRAAPSANPVQLRTSERETPFLGREAEFDTLRAAVRDMGETRTTAVLIAGEAGIGKSRLIREFSRSLALQGVRLIESRCYPAEEELPYGPIVDAISPIAREVLAGSGVAGRFPRLGYLLPDFPRKPVPEDEGVDPAAWRRRLFEEVATLLRLSIEDRPIVWVIDDAQWIDATSAGLLHYVSRRLEGTRFLLIVTVRAPRTGKLPTKLPVTPPDGSGYTQEIRLPPLTPEQIRELLLHGRPDAKQHPAVEIAQRLSAGNPFYALEVFLAVMAAAEWAQTMKDWDPLNDERLRYVLAVRFKGLPSSATRLLQCVAVLERAATPRLVAAVSGLDLDAAADESAELYARGLLHDDENRLDFVNDIMRDYVYGEMSGMRRASLHLRAARQLEREPDPSPGKLARHYQLGDEPTLAYRYAMEAARRDSDSGGHAEAAVMAGLARNTAANQTEELAALEIMAESELASAQLASAQEHFSEILRLQPGMPPEEQIRVKLRMVECSSEISDWVSGRELLEDVRQMLASVTDAPSHVLGRSESLYWGLKIAIRQNDNLLANEIARELDQLSREHLSDSSEIGPEASVSILSGLIVHSVFFESYRSAEGHIAAAIPLLDELDQSWRERIHLLDGLVAARGARWDRAKHSFDEAERLARGRQDLLQLSAVWNNQACCALEQGRWDDLEANLSKAEEALESLPDPLDVELLVLINRATAKFYQGTVREAEPIFAEALRVAQTVGAIEFIPQIHAWNALIAIQRGSREAALSSWEAVRQVRIGDYRGAQELYHLEWIQAFMTPDRGQAKDRLEGASELLQSLDRPSNLKLRWLSKVLFVQDSEEDLELRKTLIENGMGWFPFFARRWVRSAVGFRPS